MRHVWPRPYSIWPRPQPHSSLASLTKSNQITFISGIVAHSKQTDRYT